MATIEGTLVSPKKLLVIVGTTASGKSQAAMHLAQQHNGELICADSRTIYKGMDIGTAKPSATDQKLVRHHLLNIIEPDQKFTVARFQKLANQAIADIQARGKLPIMVGGTGLYIDSVIYDYSFGSKASRRPLRPNSLVLGTRISDEQLKQRINQRIQDMFGQGLEAEVQRLAKRYGWQAPGLTAVGYREWQPLLAPIEGADKLTTEIVQEQIQKDTWQYARRQRTWFRRSSDIHWQDS
ncbi:MAG: tRNA (adenosine(37)-N6)-dimethylallyltransferase MiaA [Candidatus Saccharimonadales bacterium]